MSEIKGKRLQRLLIVAMVFVMVFAQSLGAVEVFAEADAVCKVTVVVKDKETGAVIDDAKVIFTEYYKSGDEYPVVEGITRNEDGTYNVPYDSQYGEYYKYYATAKGYKTSATIDSSGALRGTNLCVEGDSMKVADILLEKEPPAERLQKAISDAQDTISNYLKKSDYDNDQQAEIDAIIKKYNDKIDAEVEVEDETEDTANAKIEILNGIIAAAKEELDKVTTSQENRNEEFADEVTFVIENGDSVSLARVAYGKFEITLSRLLAGSFQVAGNDADTSVNWNAKKEMFSYSAGGSQPFEIIDNTYDKGKFFNSKSFPSDVNLEEAVGTMEDCSVTFTKDGREVTVTFDLIITNEDPRDKEIADLEKALNEALTAKAEAEKERDEALAAKEAAEKERDEALEAMTHILIKIEAKAATPTADGNNEYYICSACDKVYKDMRKEVETTVADETISKPTEFALSATAYTYDGGIKKPTVTVKDSAGKTLVKDTDYTLTYESGRKNVGKYSVKITLKGKYSGTKTLYFTIKPAKTALTSLTATSKGFTAKWSKKTIQVSGYQIQYSTSSKFTNPKTVTITNNTTVSKKITKLNAKKKYYVRVRTYKTADTTKYYSAWSNYKYVTTK